MIKDQRNPNGLISRSDVPVEEKPQHINRYSPEEIKAMLSVADEDQTDLIQLFLRTGVRDEEAAFLEWDDVDFKRKQIFIREKPGIWKPKDKEQRIIPVEDGVLLPRLDARRKRQSPASKLVFPNTLGCPDMHLIRQLHKVIAKLKNQGVEIEGVVTLHRFRRTYASLMISHSDLQTVGSLLGHSDIETTSRYLAPDQTKARIGTRTAFQGMGD
jgi:integrase